MTNYRKDRPESIQEMFGSIARRYDRGNAVLSFGMHRYWNNQLIKLLPRNAVLLDLCCGTGDIAFGYAKKNSCKLHLLDFCKEMLECAQDKGKKLGISSEVFHADAQAIPMPDTSVDAVSIAYGIRNVRDPARCIQEAFRVLKPGGTFAILELTQPDSLALRLGHKVYLKTVLPLVGRWITANADAYSYLCKSIQNFIPPASLEEMLKQAGFKETKRQSLTGGIATLVSGLKK